MSNIGVVVAALWCSRDNVTKDYVLQVGQVQEVRLSITVSNSLEEAHEATVSIKMPPAFEYLGTDESVRIFHFSDSYDLFNIYVLSIHGITLIPALLTR